MAQSGNENENEKNLLPYPVLAKSVVCGYLGNYPLKGRKPVPVKSIVLKGLFVILLVTLTPQSPYNHTCAQAHLHDTSDRLDNSPGILVAFFCHCLVLRLFPV